MQFFYKCTICYLFILLPNITLGQPNDWSEWNNSVINRADPNVSENPACMKDGEYPFIMDLVTLPDGFTTQYDTEISQVHLISGNWGDAVVVSTENYNRIMDKIEENLNHIRPLFWESVNGGDFDIQLRNEYVFWVTAAVRSQEVIGYTGNAVFDRLNDMQRRGMNRYLDALNSTFQFIMYSPCSPARSEKWVYTAAAWNWMHYFVQEGPSDLEYSPYYSSLFEPLDYTWYTTFRVYGMDTSWRFELRPAPLQLFIEYFTQSQARQVEEGSKLEFVSSWLK